MEMGKLFGQSAGEVCRRRAAFERPTHDAGMPARVRIWLLYRLHFCRGMGVPRSTATAVMLFCGEPSMTRSE